MPTSYSPVTTTSARARDRRTSRRRRRGPAGGARGCPPGCTRGQSGSNSGAARVGDRLEHLVLDHDQLAARAGPSPGGRRRRARPARPGSAPRRWRAPAGPAVQAVDLAAGHVLVGEDGVDAGQRERLGDVDGEDPGRGMRAAQRRAPEHVLGPQVGGVRELALDLERAVGAQADCRRRRRAVDWRSSSGCAIRCTRGIRTPPSAAGRRPAASRASASSSAVRSSPSSTTISADQQQLAAARAGRRRGRRPGRRCRRGRVRPRRHSAMSASLPDLERADLVLRGRGTRAPPAVPSASACAGGQRLGGPRRARSRETYSGLAQLLDQHARLLRGRSVDAEADRRARGAAGRLTGAMPAPRRALELRAVRDAGAGVGETARSRRRRGARRARTRRPSPSQPSVSTYSTGRAAEAAPGRTPPRRAVSARCVCSRTPRSRASAADSHHQRRR